MATNFLIKKNKLERFPLTILRFFQIYGPFQKKNRLIPFVISSSLKNKKFNCSEGSQLRDFLYVDDAVESIIKSFKRKESKGKIINIGYGIPVEVKKVILMINALIKKGKPKFGRLSLRIDESKNIYPDLRVAKKILGWKNKTSLKKGLIKTIQFYKKNS
jgi:nucleoside-diphosphate-sugar epimerase